MTLPNRIKQRALDRRRQVALLDVTQVVEDDGLKAIELFE
jgi:hypothetical protein